MWLQNLKNGELYVQAKFDYIWPKTKQLYHVVRAWPCRDQDDAQRIVRYYGLKTGSYNAECIMEVYDEEIIRKRIAEAKEIAAKENSEKSSTQERSV